MRSGGRPFALSGGAQLWIRSGVSSSASVWRRSGHRTSTGLSMITVEPAGLTAKESEFIGVAIMDGRWRSDMYFGRPTMFRVEAGEHSVTVHIKRRFRVSGYRGRAVVSLQVVVGPGEHLDLVFGVNERVRALEAAPSSVERIDPAPGVSCLCILRLRAWPTGLVGSHFRSCVT